MHEAVHCSIVYTSKTNNSNLKAYYWWMVSSRYICAMEYSSATKRNIVDLGELTWSHL